MGNTEPLTKLFFSVLKMLSLDFVLPIVRSMKEIPTAVRPLARPNVQTEDVDPVRPPGLWSVGISQVNVLWGLYQNSIYINFACLYACLRPINVITAEPIGPKFSFGAHMTPGESLWLIKISKIRFSLNSENSRFFYIICVRFCYCLTKYTRRKFHNWNKRWTRSALKA